MRVFRVLLILAIILLIAYVKLDEQLAYYGKNGLGAYRVLPYKIKAEYKSDFEGGFALIDESGVSIAGRGMKYPNADFETKKILKYGVNANSVLVLVKDIRNEDHIVQIRGTAKTNPTQALYTKVMTDEAVINNDGYRWIELSKSKNLELARNYLMLFCIPLLVAVLTVIFFKGRSIGTLSRFYAQESSLTTKS